jgi:hypothetical protein
MVAKQKLLNYQKNNTALYVNSFELNKSGAGKVRKNPSQSLSQLEM